MDCKEIREMYKLMFAEYPDIVTVKDLQAMLGISRHAAYDLLGEGEISCIRLGNAYKIPKINVVNVPCLSDMQFSRCRIYLRRGGALARIKAAPTRSRGSDRTDFSEHN